MNDDFEEFNLKIKMRKRWIPTFLTMLKYMEYLGDVGSSRKVGIFVDGDGDFQMKVETDIEFEKVKPKKSEYGNNFYDVE